MAGERDEHEGGRRRFGAAIVASAVVHGLLLLALWLAPPLEPPAPTPQAPIEIEIVESPPPEPEGASPGALETANEAPGRAAPDTRAEPRAPRVAAKVGAPSSGPRPRGDGAPEGSLTVVPEEPPRPIDERFREPKELDLRLPVAPPQDEPAPAAPPLPEDRRIEQRLNELFAEDRAVETARSRPDGYWFQLRHRLEKDFSPPMEIVEAGPGSDNAGMKGAIDSYLSEAAAFGATGTPYGDDPLVPGGRRGFAHEVADDVATRVFNRPQQEAIGDTAYLSRKLVAVVEIEQGPDGSLSGAHLVSSSGIPAYDRIALDHVGKGGAAFAEALGPPPPQGRRTRWAFTSMLRIVPPAPIVGCSVDAYFIPQECFYPMKKILRHRVRLLAVYDDRKG